MANSLTEDLQDLAFRLLIAIKEKTERNEEPVIATGLSASLGMDEADTKAAFQYLADKHLIKTYNLPFAARINAAGHDAIQEAIRDAAERYSSQPDSVAERAIVNAVEQLATAGERPYKGNVPMLAQKIRERYDASRNNLCSILPSLDELMVYDNSEDADPHSGRTPSPVKLLHFRNGKILNLASTMPAWAKPIAAVALSVAKR